MIRTANDPPAAPDRFTFAALCVLAVILPFELRAPWLHLGPFVITNIELWMYLAIAVAAVEWLRRPRVTRPPITRVHIAVAAWLIVMALSALWAPTGQAAAIKFTGRSVQGVALFLVAAEVVRTTSRAIIVGAAVVIGASIAAAAGILEVSVPAVGRTLMVFREQQTLVGGFIRASGTFDYANTAAMYFEATLPLAIAAAAWAAMMHAARWLRPLMTIGVLFITIGLLLSLSRAGLLVGSAVLLGLIVVGGRTLQPLRAYAAAALALLIVCVFAMPATRAAISLRFHANDLPEWYRPAYRIEPATVAIEAGGTAVFSLLIRNQGLVAWPIDGSKPVSLSCYWESQDDGSERKFTGARFALPHRVEPGGEVTMRVDAQAPDRPGRYRLRWDLLLENVIWFSALGSRTGDVAVMVTGPIAPTAQPSQPSQRTSHDEIVIPEPRVGRRVLWGIAWRMWRAHPILGVGPDNFRHLNASYLGASFSDDRTHANSLYIETLVTLGLIGLAALGGLMLAIGLHVRRGWRRAAMPESRIVLAGVIAAAAAFFTHGLLDYFLIFTPTYALFWMVCGMLVGLTAERAPS